jgi:hypothetical protein
MATVIRRTICSIPGRTASETWERIATLLAPDGKSAGRSELDLVKGVGCSSIASEATKDDAIIVYGNGPQIRIYCLFGDDAIAQNDSNEETFAKCPLEGDWKMSIPCPAEDLDWSKRKLTACSTRVTARAVGEAVEAEKAAKTASANQALEINVEEFLKS